MDLIDLNQLDPGIRDVVALLREHGFETTDSGDGITKDLGNFENMPFPHVVVTTEEGRMFHESLRLYDFLGKADVPAGWKVEATFDPADRSTIIMVTWPL